MKKLALSIAIASTLGLTACDDTTLEDVRTETEDLRQEAQEQSVGAYVVFDPGAGNISIPNDLLFAGTSDFTLELPAETDAKDAGEAVDFSNPEAALGALDGWGTQNAFTIAMEYDDGITLDAASLATSLGDGVALYEVVAYPNLNVEGCEDTAKALQACQGVQRLTFGLDYAATIQNGAIAVVPLKPFKAGTTYIVALTKELKDSQGNPIRSSSTYTSLSQDIETQPIVDPALADSELNESQATFRTLQNVYNSYENVLADDFNANKDAIVYTQAFTTTSAGVPGTDPLQVVKLLNAQKFAAMQAEDSSSVAMPIISQGYTVAQAFVQAGAIENDPTSAAYALYNTANVYGGQIQVPYYLENADGSPLTGRWEAACDSGVALATLSTEQLTALSATTGPNHTTCQAVGLADFQTAEGVKLVDTQRHLTKYNPVPAAKSMETLNVAITVPNVDNANAFRALQGLPNMAKPDAGWPVVMLQHGITSKKEDMLAATGFLSMFGFATVAIDHPLHGDRGFVIGEGDSAVTINASSSVEGNDPTHYLNLQSLLTARDNIRQSVADGLQLRLAINGAIDVTGAVNESMEIVDPTAIDLNVFDTSKVYYVGHSLGAITGTSMVAVANTPVSPQSLLSAAGGDLATATGLAQQVEGAYKINAAFLANPGASIANFLLESGAFGPLIKASVTYASGTDLSALIQNNIADMTTTIGANLASETPSSYCQSAYADVLAGSTPAQSDALVCAYDEFYRNADATQMAGVQSIMQQFAFAAQAILEAGDPTNYAGLLAATTPTLVMQMVGDIAEGGSNPSDQVIPNYVATNPMAGTIGLATTMGLDMITDTTTNSSGTVSGIISYTKGGHSTFLSPSTSLPAPYPTIYAGLNQEIQTMMSYYFMSNGSTVNVSDSLNDSVCMVKGNTTDGACVVAEE